MICYSDAWQRVVDGNGVNISIAGVTIVFTTLLLVSLFVALIPKILIVWDKIFPPELPAQVNKDDEEAEMAIAVAVAYATRAGAKRG